MGSKAYTISNGSIAYQAPGSSYLQAFLCEAAGCSTAACSFIFHTVRCDQGHA